jgi:hypothetical protein
MAMSQSADTYELTNDINKKVLPSSPEQITNNDFHHKDSSTRDESQATEREVSFTSNSTCILRDCDVLCLNFYIDMFFLHT